MTRALLVIDVQESFRQGPLWPTISNPGIATDVARLVDGTRATGDLVVWVLHSEPGSGTTFDPASGHVRYIDPLKPLAGEPRLTKTSHNAFTTTNLQQLLTQQGITEVIVCGIRTEQCCETTARVAFDLGYQVTFVTEATATSPIAHRDALKGRTVEQLLADPRTLPASSVIERTEYALAGRFATIATIAEVTGQAAAPAPLSGAGSLLAGSVPDDQVPPHEQAGDAGAGQGLAEAAAQLAERVRRRPRLGRGVLPFPPHAVGDTQASQSGQRPGPVTPLGAGESHDGQRPARSHQLAQAAQSCPGIGQMVQRRVGHDGVKRLPPQRMGQHIPVAPCHPRVREPCPGTAEYRGVGVDRDDERDTTCQTGSKETITAAHVEGRRR